MAAILVMRRHHLNKFEPKQYADVPHIRTSGLGEVEELF